MNKKVLIAIVAVLVLVVGGALAWAAVNNVEEDDGRQSESSQQEAEQRREAALEEARTYQPPEGMACTTVMTPARHIETGVTHTFPSGCIPEGWERIDRSSTQEEGSQTEGSTEDGAQSDGQPQSDTGNRSDDMSTHNHANMSEDERAMMQARNYKPPAGQSCATVMTPARHIKTGVTYTFPSSCLPDGWEALPRGGTFAPNN